MQDINRTIYRISEISFKIAKTLEQNFSSLWIKGEISNFIAHGSGHWYFSLKEEQAQVRGVMFKGSNQQLSFLPKNGQEILVRGRITVYIPRGTYQIVCDSMELMGGGALQKRFEELKTKLKEEGLFDSKHKKAIPVFPEHIVLITSPTGAAVRDILQILRRRFKGLKITLIPALVQGEEAPSSLIKALKEAQKLSSVDSLIIGRGGGSQEDLWAFNSEELAREISRCPIPIISAVGHEIDFTICDFVSDLRAPTPSAAAELVVKNAQNLLERSSKIKKQLIDTLRFHLKFWKEKLRSLDKQLLRPEKLLEDLFQKIDELSDQLIHNSKLQIKNKKDRLENLKKLLESLNPEKVMERGFSIATLQDGKIITDSKQTDLKSKIHLQFFKGHAEVTVTGNE